MAQRRKHANNSSPSSRDSRDSSPNTDALTGKPKGGVRVSLACIPCRSKHIKCDATLPACQRCQLDSKPCYYSKSRRGIRDAKARSMIIDAPVAPTYRPAPGQAPELTKVETPWPMPHMPSFVQPPRVSPNDMPRGWSLATNIGLSNSSSCSMSLLLDLFYTTCYPTMSWVLPKQAMMRQAAAASVDLRFLISVMAFVASIREPLVASEGLREAAYSQGCGPLPMTPYTVQGLVILASTALGEDKKDMSGGWLDRAIGIALDIGMQHKSFADTAMMTDAIAAESYRRTYWTLYYKDCERAIRENRENFSLCEVAATTDLPCDEWDYQSGSIPRPVAFAEYDEQHPSREPAFSSWAYMLDLSRLIGRTILPLKLYREQPWHDEVNSAEMRIASWLLRIPSWKKDAVDETGRPDMILHRGLNTAHSIRLRLRQPWNRLQLPLKDGFAIGPLDRPINPQPLRQVSASLSSTSSSSPTWAVSPPCLSAAGDLAQQHVSLHLSPRFYGTPEGLFSTERMCLALLDACVFYGCDSPIVRQRLAFGLSVLSKCAETWPLAKRLLQGVQEVAAAFVPKMGRYGNVSGCTPGANAAVAAASSVTGDHGITAIAPPILVVPPVSPDAMAWPDTIYSTAGIQATIAPPAPAFLGEFQPAGQGMTGETFGDWLVGY